MPLIEPQPPPKPVDGPLVGSSADWWNNARLGWVGPSWSLLAAGYLDAAELLVRHVGEEHRDQDTLVYPIVFLYRQYLELMLKYLLTRSAESLDQKVVAPNHHSLLLPWGQVQPLLRRMSLEIGEEVLPAAAASEINRLLHEFDALDRTSFAFRYPVDNQGQNPISEDIRHLNLRQFGDHMRRLAYLLNGLVVATDYFDEYLRAQAEQ